MLVFDYLIGNSDRHQNNWAIIIKDQKMEWSPLYDNSSSLCAYILEEQIAGYLGKDKNRWNSLMIQNQDHYFAAKNLMKNVQLI